MIVGVVVGVMTVGSRITGITGGVMTAGSCRFLGVVDSSSDISVANVQ